MIHVIWSKICRFHQKSEYSKKNMTQQSGVLSKYLTDLTKGVKLA
ncbi:MAG: hypothetical protein ACJARX_001699 [Psychroserpens sp.]|jgi:hypothetical protein